MNKVIAVILSAEAGSYKSTLVAAAAATKDFKKDVDSSSTSMSKFASAAKAAGVAIAVVLAAVAFAALSMASDFDAAMRNVNSISQMSEGNFKNLEQSVLDLSKTVPQSATVLAQGLYDIASSGFQGAAGMNVLDASARAATAGLSDTKTAAQAIVGVLNAYGLAASESARISDVLFQTVNVGVLSFGDLAQNLGDVVGIGAAANVSINELGAAVAAITLAGVPAAEAFTSLNRVILAFVKPTGEMTSLMHNLGYESAFTALQTLGLHGVMEKLRTVTGGNVEVLTTLFGDVRAGRGAFALMSAEGENYNRTFAALTDQTQVAGATQRAFTEQMKSLSAQWGLFINRISAGAIEVGLHAIPVLVSGLAGLQVGIESTVTAGQDAAQLLGPFFTGIASAAVSLGNVAMNLASDLEPAAKMFAILAGSTVVVTLTLLASALAGVAGFLEEHRLLVEAIAALYAGRFVGSLIVAATNMEVLNGAMKLFTKLGIAGIVQDVALRVMYLTEALVGVGGAGTYIASLKAAFSGLGATIAGLAPTIVGTAVIGSFILINNMLDDADKKAKALVSDLTKNVSTNNISTITDALGRLQQKLAEIKPAAGDSDPFLALYDSLTGDGPQKANAAVDKLKKSIEELQLQELKIRENSTGLMEALGIPVAAVLQLADKAGINLGTLANKDLPWAVAQMQPLIDATQGGTVATDALGVSFQTAADATASATDRVKAYKDALDALIGIHLSVFDANTKLAAAQDTLNEKLGTFGFNLDETSKAGREVRDALSGAVDAAVGLAKSIADEQGIPAGVAVLQKYRDGLALTLQQAGLTDQQIQYLLTSLGLTDANFVAELSLNGADQAQTQVDNLNTSLAAAAESKKIDIVTAPAITGLTNLDEKAYEWAGLDPTAIAHVNAIPAYEDMDRVARRAQEWAESDPTAMLYANVDLAYTNMDRVARRAQEYAESNPTAQVQANTETATQQFENWLLNNQNRSIVVDINTRDKTRFGQPMRWGGAVEHAASGLVRFRNASIYDNPTYGIAESGTGGEAFIPKYGNRARSLAIAATAASWYGASVIDSAKKATMISGRPMSAQPVTGGATTYHVEVAYSPAVNLPNYVGDHHELIGAVKEAMADSHGELVKVTSEALYKNARGSR